MANRDGLLKIDIEADVKPLVKQLMEGISSAGNEAEKELSDRLEKAFMNAGRNPKLRKQLTGLYQGLFDDLTIAGSNQIQANLAIDKFIGKLEYLQKIEKKTKINGVLNNLSVGDIDKLLRGYDEVAEKQRKISEYTSESFKTSYREKNIIKSLQSIREEYKLTGEEQKKYLKDVEKKFKSTGVADTSNFSNEINQYSELLSLFEKIANTKTDRGTDADVKKYEQLLFVMKQINSFEEKATFLKSLRSELSTAESSATEFQKKINESLSGLEFSNGVVVAIDAYIKKITQPLKDEINNIFEDAATSAKKMSQSQSKKDVKIQNKIEEQKENESKSKAKSDLGLSNSDLELYRKHFDNASKSANELDKRLEEVESRLYDLYDMANSEDETIADKFTDTKVLKEYILLLKEYDDITSNIPGYKKDESFDEIYNNYVKGDKVLETYSNHIDDIIKKSREYKETTSKSTIPVIGTGSSSDKTHGYNSEEINNLKEELKIVRDEINLINDKINILESNTGINDITSQISNLDSELKNVNSTIDSITRDIGAISYSAKTDIVDVVNVIGKRLDEVFVNNNGKNISPFWNSLKDQIDNTDVGLKNLLRTVGLLNKNSGSINIIEDGLNNSGGIIGDVNTIIARKNNTNSGITQYEKSSELKSKLEEAYDAGIKVARILDIIGDKESNVILEVQETQSGSALGKDDIVNPELSYINNDFLKATDEQILKLIQDILTLQDLGLSTDVNLSNLFYDKKEGFSFIDLGVSDSKFSFEDIIQDITNGIQGSVRVLNEEVNKVNIDDSIIDNFEEKFIKMAEVAKQGYAEGQNSHSPSIDFNNLEGDAVDGVEQRAMQESDRLKSIGTQMAEDVKEGFQKSIDELKGRVSELETSFANISEKMSNIETTDAFSNLARDIKDLKEQVDELNDSFRYTASGSDNSWWISEVEIKVDNLKERIEEVSKVANKASEKLFSTNINNQQSASKTEQYKEISSDTVSVLSDIGKSEEEIVAKIRSEIKEAEKLNQVTREHLILLDKEGKVVANHWGSQNNVNGNFSDEDWSKAKGGKIMHVHPGDASFFGQGDMNHLFSEAIAQNVKQVELLWGDSTLSIDTSEITKQKSSIIHNIMRNVRTTLTEMYSDNKDGQPSADVRYRINAIEKEIFKSITDKLGIAVTEQGIRAQEVTSALSDVDKAIIKRFKNVESKVVQDINVPELIKTNQNPILSVEEESLEDIQSRIKNMRDFLMSENDIVTTLLFGDDGNIKSDIKILQELETELNSLHKSFVNSNPDGWIDEDYINALSPVMNKFGMAHAWGILDYDDVNKIKDWNGGGYWKDSGFFKNLFSRSSGYNITDNLTDDYFSVMRLAIEASESIRSLSDDTNNSFLINSEEKNDVNEVVESEISKFGELENVLKSDVVNAIETKTEKFEDERDRVSKAIDDEIEKLGLLQNKINDIKSNGTLNITTSSNQPEKYSNENITINNAEQEAREYKEVWITAYEAAYKEKEIREKKAANEYKAIWITAYENAYKENEKYDKEKNKESNDIKSVLSKELSKTYDKYDNAFKNKEKYVEEYSLKLKEIETEIEKIKSLGEVDSFSDDDINQAKNLQSNIEVLFDELNGISKKGNQAKASSLSAQISQYASSLTKMGSEVKNAKSDLSGFVNELRDPNISASRIQEIAAAFGKIKTNITEAGKAGRGFIDIFKNKLKYTVAQQFAMYFSLNDFIRYIRTAISTITELDTALVDLRKTSTMTSSELSDFYFASNDVAKKMGVTTAEIINQASAWSRLGYSSKEASIQMAELSSQFASISPGMSTDEAQTGLVSIMKAWDIQTDDVERKIMDNINILGNRFAETNSDIITGMEKAAATFSALGQSTEDTFALFTGAQEIQQNAETVGTALKTLSLRIRGMNCHHI